MLNFEAGNWLGYLVSALLFAGGCALLLNHFRLRGKCTSRVTARVTRILEEEHVDSDPDTGTTISTVYIPVFQFRLPDGSLMEGGNGVGRSRCKYQIGEQVEICYNPDNPEQIFVPRDNLTIILAGAAFVVVGVGCFLLTMFNK